MHHAATIVSLLVSGVVLAGCGTTTTPGAPTSATSPTITSRFSQTSGALVQVPVEVTGTVGEGVEAGCKVLAPAGGGPGLLLLGKTDGLPLGGGTVTVRGRYDDEIMTTCQQGRPFIVEHVLPAAS